MKRARLPKTTELSWREVNTFIKAAGHEKGRWLRDVADHFNVDQGELFDWLKLHGFRTKFSELLHKQLVLPK